MTTQAKQKYTAEFKDNAGQRTLPHRKRLKQYSSNGYLSSVEFEMQFKAA